jgi:hypothetical protein
MGASYTRPTETQQVTGRRSERHLLHLTGDRLRRNVLMLEQLTRDTSAHHLHNPLSGRGRGRVCSGHGTGRGPCGASPPGYEAFSIVFRGPSDPLLPQGMHRFHRDAIGTFDLFIVPIRRDQHGLYYEAVFNRTAHMRRRRAIPVRALRQHTLGGAERRERVTWS